MDSYNSYSSFVKSHKICSNSRNISDTSTMSTHWRDYKIEQGYPTLFKYWSRGAKYLIALNSTREFGHVQCVCVWGGGLGVCVWGVCEDGGGVGEGV